MPVSWKPSTEEAHEALPRKRNRGSDTEWDAVMKELQQGNTVRIEYRDNKERGILARAVGRSAEHRGFKVDLRQGDGFISVRKADSA